MEDHPSAQAVTRPSRYRVAYGPFPCVLQATAPFLLTHDFASRHIRLSFQKEPRVEEKPGVTRELRSLAKSNIAAESKTRRRAIAMVVAAVLAVCVWAVVHFLL